MVLGNIMRSKYLWNNIRELGGALVDATLHLQEMVM